MHWQGLHLATPCSAHVAHLPGSNGALAATDPIEAATLRVARVSSRARTSMTTFGFRLPSRRLSSIEDKCF